MPLVTCGADGSTRAEVIEQINNNTTENVFNVDSMTDLLSIDFTIYKTVNVRGYYNLNDSGGGLFNWDSTIDKSTANAGTIIDPGQTLANQGNGSGLGCWVSQYIGAINVKGFGAKGDGITNDTIAIQNAIDYITKGTVYIPTGVYLISASLVVPNGVSLIGDPNGTEILMSASGTFTNDYGILINSTDGVSWVVSYPGINSGKIEFIKMNTSAYANSHKGILLASSYKLENLRFSRMVTSIATTNDYLDSIYISQVNCGYGESGGYQIAIHSLGDGLFINSVLCHQGSPKGVYVAKCAGGLVTGIINGDIELFECSALKVSGIHNENGQVIIDNSSVSIENAYFWDTNVPAIKFISTNDGRTSCSLKDVAFKYRLDDTDNATLSDYNIQLSANIAVSINNVHRQILKTGALSIVETMGAIIANSSGTLLDDFNDYSYFLSENSFIGYDYILELNKQLLHNDATFYPFSAIGLNNNVTWKAATNTYYYDVAMIRDKTRQVGRNNQGGDSTVAPTNGGNGVLLTLGTSGNNPNSFYRVYRGTSSNSYTEYVDIPYIAVRNYYDDGETLNGFKWQSRTASDADAVNTGNKTVFNGENIDLFRSSIPTAGTWKAGDRIINPTPAAGGKIGWICITAGSPGTFKAFGAIDA